MNMNNLKPIVRTEMWNLQDLVDKTQTGKLNPDPLGQRPPSTVGDGKSVSIIRSLVEGYGLGTIVLRDITATAAKGTPYEEDNRQAREVYEGFDFLVGDGGHRIRALNRFYGGHILINGEKYVDMWERGDFRLTDIMVPVVIYTCSAKQFSTAFKNVNTTTPVNFMEMIMSDDVTPVLKDIRSIVKFYKEYNNDCHPLFELRTNMKTQKVIPVNFAGNPNPRRKWDEWVAIALIKARGKGNVDAGESQIAKLAEEVCAVPSSNLDVVRRFLDDALEFRKVRNRQWSGGNSTEFGAFMLFWFGLYDINQNFVIDDYMKFQQSFKKAYDRLTDKNRTKTYHWKGDTVILTKWFKDNVTSFAQGDVQQACFDLMMKEMKIDETNLQDIGVITRQTARSVSISDREKFLATQDYKCAIDGLELTLEDSVFGHNTPWSKGGELKDGAVIRREHNVDMGRLTIDEYRFILKLRSEKKDFSEAA